MHIKSKRALKPCFIIPEVKEYAVQANENFNLEKYAVLTKMNDRYTDKTININVAPKHLSYVILI